MTHRQTDREFKAYLHQADQADQTDRADGYGRRLHTIREWLWLVALCYLALC